MKEFLQRSGILAAALLGGNVGGMLILPFGLVLVEFVVFPLTFCIAGIFAAIDAGWAGHLLVPGRSRLLPILGASEVAAAAVSVLLLAVLALVRPQSPAEAPALFLPSPVVLLGIGVVFIALSAGWAAWRCRSPESRPGRDAAITLGLLALAVLLVVATLFVAGLFGLAGV